MPRSNNRERTNTRQKPITCHNDRFPDLKADEAKRWRYAAPPVAAAFTDQVRPQIERMIAGVHESRTLAALRDALLPKLISGELRVNAPDTGTEGVRP